MPFYHQSSSNFSLASRLPLKLRSGVSVVALQGHAKTVTCTISVLELFRICFILETMLFMFFYPFLFQFIIFLFPNFCFEGFPCVSFSVIRSYHLFSSFLCVSHTLHINGTSREINMQNHWENERTFLCSFQITWADKKNTRTGT